MRQDGMRDLTMQMQKVVDGLIRLQLRQAKVVSADATTPPTITITLDDTNISGVRYFASYTPTANDNVWLLVNGSDILALGKLA